MATNLPTNRIKKIKLPNNTEYTIVPEILQHNGYQISLPTLSSDDEFVTTNTVQTITERKTFNNGIITSDIYSASGADIMNFISDGWSQVGITGHLSVFGDDDDNFRGKPDNYSGFSDLDTSYFNTGITLFDADSTSKYQISFPGKSGTFLVDSNFNFASDINVGDGNSYKTFYNVYLFDDTNDNIYQVNVSDNTFEVEKYNSSTGFRFNINTGVLSLLKPHSVSLSYTLPSASGTLATTDDITITSADRDILDVTITPFKSLIYAPYAIKGAGHLYTGTANPSSTNRLNYDGYFYATKLYSGGAEVKTTDNNYYPTAMSWTNGTTAGPTATITMSGISNISVGAIPSADDNQSGIVTTGNQNFSGNKYFNSENTSFKGHITVYGDSDSSDTNKPSDETGFGDLDTFYYNTGITLVDQDDTEYQISFPAKSGTFAITDDLPDIIDLRS